VLVVFASFTLKHLVNCIMFPLAHMAHLSARPRVRRAGTRGADVAS
jgi:hypothetical protein